jgi:hypothetical protein
MAARMSPCAPPSGPYAQKLSQMRASHAMAARMSPCAPPPAPHAQKLSQMRAGYAMAARISPCAPPPGPIQLLNQLIAFCVKPELSFQKFRRLSEPSSFHSKVPETFATVIVSFKSLLAITFGVHLVK